MTLDEVNRERPDLVRSELARCCGATAWQEQMLARRPFASQEELLAAASEIWRGLGPSDWREAFLHHPRIGDVSSLRKKFAATAGWAAAEQAGTLAAPDELLAGFAEANRAYEQRFGHIFIVCATGKSAAEMLALLDTRAQLDADDELRIAAGEQEKITRLRLEKLLQASPVSTALIGDTR